MDFGLPDRFRIRRFALRFRISSVSPTAMALLRSERLGRLRERCDRRVETWRPPDFRGNLGQGSSSASGADFQIGHNAEMIAEPDAVDGLVERERCGPNLAGRFRMSIPGPHEHIID